MKRIYDIKVNSTNISKSNPNALDCFKINDIKDYIFAGKRTQWAQIAKPDIVEEIKKIINNFDEKHFINNINLLYRFPDLTMSRDKLSIFKDKVNFKITRDKEKADICVVSQKLFDNMLDHNWCSLYNKNEILSNINIGLKLDSNLQSLIDFINEKDDDSLFMVDGTYNYRTESNPSDLYSKIFSWLDKLSNNDDRTYCWYFKDNNHYQWIKDNKYRLIFDTDLNTLCTADSVTLDINDYERLEELLKSNDTDNVSIALTLMANCNVKKSKTILSLSFAFYSEEMKRSNVWNQVNFKYLRTEFNNYINLSLSNWGHAYDAIIKRLIEDNALTLWASQYIANKMFIGVLQNNFGVGTDGGVFTIDAKSLQLKDEYKNKLYKEIDLKKKEESEVISDLILNQRDKGLLPF